MTLADRLLAGSIREWLESEYGTHPATRDEIAAFMSAVISTRDDRLVAVSDILDSSFSVFRGCNRESPDFTEACRAIRSNFGSADGGADLSVGEVESFILNAIRNNRSHDQGSGDCGCWVDSESLLDGYRIIYCPLHAAAQTMMDACNEAYEWLQGDSGMGSHQKKLVQQLADAVSDAKGAE